jgi:ribonuclease P/MRP protein subunit POP1
MLPRDTEISQHDYENLVELTTKWPPDISYSNIYDSTSRQECSDAKPTDKEINDRKAKVHIFKLFNQKSLLPGQPLEQTPQDPHIPILLIQTQISNPANTSNNNNNTFAGYTIILPKNWARPFWVAFIFAGARVGGIREMHRLSYEANIPYFPFDYIGTMAYNSYIDNKRILLENEHFKKPKGKRVPYYNVMGICEPFESPFWIFDKELVDLRSQGSRKLGDEDYKPGSEDDTMWNERYKNVHVLKSKKMLNKLITCLASNDLEGFMNYIKQYGCDASSLFVQCELSMDDRGVAKENAVLYVPHEQNGNESTGLDVDKDEKTEDTSKDGDHERIVGFVTTGGYSFGEGKSTAIATCNVPRLFQLSMTNERYSQLN